MKYLADMAKMKLFHLEDIEKLTEGYQRLDEKKNRNIEGTGLGLGLVKGILSLMNSKLEVESTYGEKSVLILIIPTWRSEFAGKIDSSTTAQFPIVPTVEMITSFFRSAVRGFSKCAFLEIKTPRDKSNTFSFGEVAEIRFIGLFSS